MASRILFILFCFTNLVNAMDEPFIPRSLMRSKSFSDIQNINDNEGKRHSNDKLSFCDGDYETVFTQAFEDPEWSEQIEPILQRAGFVYAGKLRDQKVYTNNFAMYSQRSGISGFCLLAYGPRLFAPASGDFHLWLNHEMIQTLEIQRQTLASLQPSPLIERIDRLTCKVKTILNQDLPMFSGPLPSTEILREYNELVALKRTRSLSHINLMALANENERRAPLSPEFSDSDSEGAETNSIRYHSDDDTDMLENNLGSASRLPRIDAREIEVRQTWLADMGLRAYWITYVDVDTGEVTTVYNQSEEPSEQGDSDTDSVVNLGSDIEDQGILRQILAQSLTLGGEQTRFMEDPLRNPWRIRMLLERFTRSVPAA